jgi:deoxyribose-phosphate aldolase
MVIYRKIYEYLDDKNKKETYNLIDYTNLSENLDNDQIKKLCDEAEENNFYSICILPEFVSKVYSFLDNNIKVTALIDFPKGKSKINQKIDAIKNSITNGAKEVDVVIDYEMVKDNEEELNNQIRNITEYCHKEGVIIKLVIEIGALNHQEMEKICNLCIDNNVDFVVTSTGKLPNDNSFEEKLKKVKYIRKMLPEYIKIKFTGGVRTINQINELKQFVDRIGTSIIPQ